MVEMQASGERVEAMLKVTSAARTVADRVDPFAPDTPTALETIDYVKFKHWYSRVLNLLGKDDGHKEYSARTVFELRMTPEEAAAEIDWEAFWG